MLLHFGAVDYRATVWINGRSAGSTKADTRRSGSISPSFSIPVRIVLRCGWRTRPRIATSLAASSTGRSKPESIFYTRTTGIWQTVWLEPVGDSYLERVRIDTNLDGLVTFEAKVVNACPDTQFIATIRHKGRFLSTSMVEVEGGQATGASLMRDPEWWSPDAAALIRRNF